MAKQQAFSEIKSQSEAQLKTQLADLRKEQLNLRFQKAAGTLANFNRWRTVRKVIARVKTALNMGGK
jgi:large subunit ribosomal protein L29